MIAKISTRLDTSTDRAWDAVKKSATLLHVTRGFLGFAGARGFPEEWREGDAVRTRLVFFHLIPAWWTHQLRVVRLDDQNREIYTNEGGGSVPVWNHRITIAAVSEASCRYADEIEIRAGFLTPLVWLYAHIFYRYRQTRWRRLARSLT